MSCEDNEIDEGVMCDFCHILHPSINFECDYSILANMILDVDRKVNDQWEMNYKSIENISKRVSKVEDDIISLYRKIEFYENSIQRKWQTNTELSQRLTNLENEIGNYVTGNMIFEMRQIIETWQRGCEVQLSTLMKCNEELEKRLNEVSGEIENLKRTKAEATLVADYYIKTEKRLLKLERHFSGDYQLIGSKLNPHKCPVCDGKYIAVFKECESACLVCEKGIVWG